MQMVRYCSCASFNKLSYIVVAPGRHDPSAPGHMSNPFAALGDDSEGGGSDTEGLEAVKNDLARSEPFCDAPQTPDFPSSSDIETCRAVLEAFAQDADLYKSKPVRGIRQLLYQLLPSDAPQNNGGGRRNKKQRRAGGKPDVKEDVAGAHKHVDELASVPALVGEVVEVKPAQYSR